MLPFGFLWWQKRGGGASARTTDFWISWLMTTKGKEKNGKGISKTYIG